MEWEKQRVQECFQAFIQTYLVERNAEKTALFFTDDIVSIGTGAFEVGYGIKEVTNLIRREIEQDPEAYEVFWRRLEISEQLESFFVFCDLEVNRRLGSGEKVIFSVRLTATMREIQGKYYICNVHASAPAASQEEEEFYPVKFSEKTIQSLHESAQKKAFELLNNSLAGGMIGGYNCKDFPLYFVNDKLLETLGYTREEFVQDTGGYVINGIYPEDREFVCQVVEESFRQSDEYHVKYRMLKKGGDYIWVQDHGKRMTVDGDDVIISVCIDITDSILLQQRLEQTTRQLQRSNHELSAITNNLPGGICKVKCDDVFTLLYGNEGFYEIYGYTPKQMKEQLDNQLIRTILPEDVKQIKKVTEEAFRNGTASFEFEKRIFRADGKMIWALTRGNFQNEDGVFFMNCVIMDISERKQIEQQLRTSEERYRIALEQMKNIVFDYDIETNTITYQLPSKDQRGQFQSIATTPEQAVADGKVASDYQQQLFQMYRNVSRGIDSSCEVKIHSDRKNCYIWSKFSMTVLKDTQGKPYKAIGVMEDITAEKERELSYFNSDQYRQMLLSQSVGHVEVNLTQDMVKTAGGIRENQFSDLSSLTYHGFLEDLLKNHIHPQDRENYQKICLRENLLFSFYQGKTDIQIEHREVDKNWKVRWLRTTIKLIREGSDTDVKAISYIQDIDDQKKENLSLKYRSQRDSMTGLYNRASTEALIQEVLNRGIVKGSVAFLILDIDYFKQINDTKGHLFGDRVLTEMSGKIRNYFRSDDIIGRVGGDEFVIFMNEVLSSDVVIKKAEQICQVFHGSFDGLSCSIGISIQKGENLTFNELYRQADIALYQAKRNGRDQYMIYQNHMYHSEWVPSSTVIDEPSSEEGSSAFRDEAYDIREIILNEFEEVVYLSDPKTYELVYLNPKAREDLGLVGEEYVGQKCYKVLQGKDAPCSFCTNHLLKENGEAYLWKNRNNIFKKDYRLRDKFVRLNGRLLRMEVAVDITPPPFDENENFE